MTSLGGQGQRGRGHYEREKVAGRRKKAGANKNAYMKVVKDVRNRG
jgi:hypothetical protein